MVAYPVVVRKCVVSVADAAGLTHSITVQAGTLFEAAAAALAAFREQGWAADALTPYAVLMIEVPRPSVIHKVPIQAVERWQGSPSTSPKELLAKRYRSSNR
jgi:hypothetical protein